jgi:hypothetical protein
MTKEQHIHQARLKKAHAIAELLHTNGISACDVSLIPEQSWNQLAAVCRVRPPSPRTIDLIHEAMVSLEHLDEMRAANASMESILREEEYFARAYMPKF